MRSVTRHDARRRSVRRGFHRRFPAPALPSPALPSPTPPPPPTVSCHIDATAASAKRSPQVRSCRCEALAPIWHENPVHSSLPARSRTRSGGFRTGMGRAEVAFVQDLRRPSFTTPTGRPRDRAQGHQSQSRQMCSPADSHECAIHGPWRTLVKCAVQRNARRQAPRTTSARRRVSSSSGFGIRSSRLPGSTPTIAVTARAIRSVSVSWSRWVIRSWWATLFRRSSTRFKSWCSNSR